MSRCIGAWKATAAVVAVFWRTRVSVFAARYLRSSAMKCSFLAGVICKVAVGHSQCTQ